ncbi:MAG: Lrp/AsnC family transcriptional regulator [Thaumarchaeota archaeon]|nr:Lrp/AsnC family transcriptional regulator [Nitrososphaerota archaeon]
MNSEIDKLDRQVVAELIRDSSQSTVKLAEKLGVTRQTVASRISKLQKQGVVSGFKAKIDYRLLGYSTFFVLFLKIGNFDEYLLSKALGEFRASPHVLMDTSVTGEWDIMQVLAFKDTNEYDEYIARIRTKYGKIFRDSKSHAILKFFKSPDEFFPTA